MSNHRISAASVAVQKSVPKLDVDAIGIASLPDLKGTKLAKTALRLLPETSSIVVLAMEVYPEILDLTRPGRMMGTASLNDLLDRTTPNFSAVGLPRWLMMWLRLPVKMV